MKQTELLQKQDLVNRLYINWAYYNRETRRTETRILLFPKSFRTKPFQKQIPKRIMNTKQLREEYGVEIE